MKIKTLILIVFLMSQSNAGHYNRIHHFEKGYSFSYSFECGLPIDSLLSVLFSFDHLTKYSSNVHNMSLVEKGKKSYIVAFSINYLFYSSESEYRRTIIPETNMIVIDMIKFKHNSSIIPKVIGSRVEYRLTKKNDKTEVNYNQKCIFDKQVNWFYLKIIEGKLNESAKELMQYIEFLEKK